MGNYDFDSTQPFGATLALREALQKLGEARTSARDTLLFSCGEQPEGVFLILAGKVTLTLAEHGMDYFRTIGPGSLLGLPSTMCMKPYSLTARVLEPLEYIFVPCNVVKDFLRTRPDLCFQVVEILAREVREMRHATGQVASAASAANCM